MRQMCCCLQTVITCRCLTSSPVYEMNFETTRLHLDFLSTNYLDYLDYLIIIYVVQRNY